MQLLERTATFLTIVGLAVPYLMLMGGALAVVELCVGVEDRFSPVAV